MLALTERMESLPWPVESFSITDTNWRLGVGQISTRRSWDIMITIHQRPWICSTGIMRPPHPQDRSQSIPDHLPPGIGRN